MLSSSQQLKHAGLASLLCTVSGAHQNDLKTWPMSRILLRMDPRRKYKSLKMQLKQLMTAAQRRLRRRKIKARLIKKTSFDYII